LILPVRGLWRLRRLFLHLQVLECHGRFFWFRLPGERAVIYLKVKRDIADFIKQQGAAISFFKNTFRSLTAPVKDPFLWPKSSLSINVSGIPPQFKTTNGCSLLRLCSWMALAINSLPVPLSPVIRMLVFVLATCIIRL